jgi:hypothetical protein
MEPIRQSVRSGLIARPSRASFLILWVEVAESGAGVGGGEVPVHLTLVGVGGVLPGGQLVVEDGQVVDPPVQALAAK